MYRLPGGVGTQCNILTGIPEICLRYRKSIAVVKWMEIKFSMFLNFFDVTLIFFRCFFSMFSLSMFFLFRVFAFLCFVVLCFVIDPELTMFSSQRSQETKEVEFSNSFDPDDFWVILIEQNSCHLF